MEQSTSTPIKQYTVSVVRTVTQTMNINVSADSEYNAAIKAVEIAPNIDFGGREKGAEYVADMVFHNKELQKEVDKIVEEDECQASDG